MKKIQICLITVLFFNISILFADSYLQISLYDDGDFRVVMDNSELSSPGNVAEFDHLSAGEHYLKVIRETAKVPAVENVTFEGKIKIPADYSVFAVIDEYNAFTIYKKIAYSNGRGSLDLNYYRKCGGNNVDYNNHKDKNIQNDQCSGRMTDDNFKALKKSIGDRNFETTNTTVLKDALDRNTLSADQVKELLSFFTFESNKLEIAKYAYKNTCDKNNYFKIYDLFAFDSSVDELKNYISGK